MSEPIQCTFSYPAKTEAGAPARFDKDFYLNKHLPLVNEVWGPHGLKSWSVAEFPSEHPLDGTDMPYTFQTTVTFESEERLQAALLSPDAKKTTENTINFTDVKPVVWVGKVAATKVF